MSVTKLEEISLCFDNEEFDLELNEFFEILHSKIGEPMRTFKIRSGDTAPVLRATLRDKDGDAVTLTSNNTIKFIMREDFYYNRSEEQIHVQNADNIAIAPQNGLGTKGKFQYNWAVGDTDCSGSYCGVFQITLNGVEVDIPGPYKLTDGMTLTVEFDGVLETFTFNTADFVDINLAEADEIVTKINSTITGGIAVLTGDSKKILLQSLDKELTGSVQITGGTLNNILDFSVLLAQNRVVTLPTEPIPIKILKNFDQE